MSGIAPDDACLEAFNALKMKSTYKWVIFKIDEDKVTVLETEPGTTKATFADFCGKLPADDCRYAVYDFEYDSSKTGAKASKVIFIHWGPDTARIRSKMIYASTKESFKRTLTGIQKDMQASDVDDLTVEALTKLCEAV